MGPASIRRHPRARRPRGARGRLGGVRGTPVRCRDRPQGCGESSRAAGGGVIVAPPPAMVDGESKAGGSGPAAGTAGWPEPCSAFNGHRVRRGRGCLPGPRSPSQRAGQPRVPAGPGCPGEERHSHQGKNRFAIWGGPLLFSCSGS